MGSFPAVNILIASPSQCRSISPIDKQTDLRHFANICRLITIGYRAHSTMLILSMSSLYEPNEIRPLIRPSQSPHAREVVFITAESPDGNAQRQLFVTRDASGKCTDLIEEDPRPFHQVEGPIFGILPQVSPPLSDVQEAQTLLEQLKINLCSIKTSD